MTKLIYYCDRARHLVCVPYSIENLHRMAEDLNIKRRWYHAGFRRNWHNIVGHNLMKKPHYDIPKRRRNEIMAKCIIVDSRIIVAIILGEYPCSEDRL